MLDEAILEKRLVTIEQAVSKLQLTVERRSSENWLEILIDSISDEEAFLEALEYGRAFRQVDKPTGQLPHPQGDEACTSTSN